MDTSEKVKWAFSFTLLGICGWWFRSVWDNEALLNAAFSGVLVVLITLVVQHWFRRSKPQ